MLERGIGFVRTQIWKRTRRLYGYHLGLLLFAFTIIAAVAHFGPSQALHNFLAPFFHSPGWASFSALLLLYQPPLMDILPMYIAFMGLTPLLLRLAARRGWRPLLMASALVWVAGQLEAGRGLYDLLAAAGYPLPREAWSSFDWFAWQLLWVVGLWLGSPKANPALTAQPERFAAVSPWFRRVGTYVLIVAIAAAAGLFCARHHITGVVAGLDLNGPLASKWHLGPLRLANFALLGFIAHRLLLPLLHWLRIGALELLGRSSLQVFTAHIPVCILADGLLLDTAAVALPLQSTLLALMLAVMLLVAWRADSPRREARARKERSGLADRRAMPAQVSMSRPVSVMPD
jgi:hypothetical protein